MIEGSAARIFTDRGFNQQIAHQLATAMLAGARDTSTGEKIAPNLYTIAVHSIHFQELRGKPESLEEMAWNLENLAHDTGFSFYSPPVVRIVEDTTALPHQVQVNANISIEQLADTSDMPVENQVAPASLPENAFVVIDGTRLYPLTKPVVNIGRRRDNDIVISDERVSRVHAQLRASGGHYLIFDLDSSGGTFVNDQQVTQSVLFPGDVVSLAGVPIVYGQENDQLGQTQKVVQIPD